MRIPLGGTVTWPGLGATGGALVLLTVDGRGQKHNRPLLPLNATDGNADGDGEGADTVKRPIGPDDISAGGCRGGDRGRVREGNCAAEKGRPWKGGVTGEEVYKERLRMAPPSHKDRGDRE